MFMVNRLLVEYNLELNKYVDLESEKINYYSNKDLPVDIFEDKDKWFYEISPYDLLKQAKLLSENLTVAEKTLINAHADKLLQIIKTSNQLRFDMDKVSVGVDFTKKENITKVYTKLEEGVKLFNDFYSVQLEFQKVLDELATKYTDKTNANYASYQTMTQVHKTSKLILAKLRSKETESLNELVKVQSSSITAFAALKMTQLSTSKAIQDKLNFHFNNCLNSVREMNKSASLFNSGESVPSKYKLYGRFYYYYNVELISKNNKYGSGLTFELNNLLKQVNLPFIRFTEMPHIFQIIYPKKIESGEVIKATDNNVFIPETVKERTVTKNKVIRVDGPVVTLQLYDHMIQDGDIVSINFNGDWILEKEELEKGSKTVKIKLNEEGKNFLLLHAESVGKRPPNTMALSYMYKGEKKEIILKSDLNTSELIEIIQAKN